MGVVDDATHFLLASYRAVNGNLGAVTIHLRPMAEQLGWELQRAENAATYLADQGALRFVDIGGGYQLTVMGVDTVEAAQPPTERQGQRLQFLKRSHEKSGGNVRHGMDMWEVGEELGFDRETTTSVWDYLNAKGLVEAAYLGGGYTITSEGIRYIEEGLAPSPPTSHVADSASPRSHDVALSYASEQREYVEKVATFLKDSGVTVFYDRDETPTLWGKSLSEYLEDVYCQRARYCILFASADYARKMWTRHERRSALARAIGQEQEYILPVRFDDTPIDGLNSTVRYLDAEVLSPKEVAEVFIQKLREADQ